MLRIPIASVLALFAVACSTEAESQKPMNPSTSGSNPTGTEAAGFYALETNTLEGQPASLDQYAGQVSLVVNVASKCGYTRQYDGLQKLHAELADKGFQVLGFPSNDFGGQEPGSPAEIREFCSSTYSVEFPMFEKVATKGADQSPIYAHLQAQVGDLPNWNFCKYLIGKDGQVLGFWKSSTTPEDDELRKAIDAALGS